MCSQSSIGCGRICIVLTYTYSKDMSTYSKDKLKVHTSIIMTKVCMSISDCVCLLFLYVATTTDLTEILNGDNTPN